MRYLLSLILLCLIGCASRAPIDPTQLPSPVTVTEEDEQYGHEVLSELVDRYALDTNDKRINRVRDIVDKITAANNLDQDPWHVYVLLDDDFKNAAATRGNYVFVWTGMLKLLHDDAELATVLSHEIGHVVAGHTMPSPAEEVQQMIGGIAGMVASGVVSAQGPGYGGLGDIAGSLVQSLFETVLINPESQRQELEADLVGMFLMADAGYDPAVAVELWQRLSEDPEFSSTIEFLSTHPNTENRVENLKAHLEEARLQYKSRKPGRR